MKPLDVLIELDWGSGAYGLIRWTVMGYIRPPGSVSVLNGKDRNGL